MWFHNLQIYRLPENWGLTAEALAEKLAARPFQPCGSQDMASRGWSSPTKDDRFVLAVGGHFLISLAVEQKLLPSSVVNEVAADKAEMIEAQQDYKPGRKQMKEIKEAVLQELLPRAFTRRRRVFSWIDPVGGWLVIDAASQARAEEVLEALRDTLDELPVKMVKTQLSPVSVMTDWLAANEAAGAFTIDLDCKLSAVTDEHATVRYARHSLDGSDVRNHLAAGKLPEMLGLTYDDRVSFILTEKLAIKRISFLDVVKTEAENQAKAADLQQEADFAIMAGEMQRVIRALIDSLGGEAPLDLADQGTETNPYGDGSESDPLYEKAVEIVTSTRRPSISLVQRHLRIGYNRAARLIEQMERSGLVTPLDSSGTRKLTATAIREAA